MSQRPLLLFFAALGTLTPVLGFLLVMLGIAEPYLTSNIVAGAILVGMLGAIAVPFLPLRDRGATLREQVLDLLVIWTWASALAQFGWELPFVLLSQTLKGVTANDHWFFLFWSYGVADQRYLIADPFTVCMEAVTSMIGGPLEIYVLYLFKRGRLRTAVYWAVIISATQLYGTVLFFGIEALEGFRHVGQGAANVWIKFVGLNGVWMVMPVVCLFAYYKGILGGLEEKGSAGSR